MFLSMIPLIMLILSLIRQVGATVDQISAVTNDLAPEAVSSFINIYLEEIINNSKLSLTIVSAIVLLWSASRGIFSIIGGLNSVYEIKEARNYFMIRVTAIFYTLAFILMLSFVLLLMVFGGTLNDILYSLFPNLKGLVYIVSSLRFILGFLLLILFFSLLYKTLPNCKMKLVDQVPGAVITSAGWVSFSILFSFFVNNFSNYANIYGSLSAIIILLLWLYICMYIMFIGAEVNCILTTKIIENQSDR